MQLHNWSVVSSNQSPYLAPELRKIQLCGKVYGHPNFPNGSIVTTSSIVKVIGTSVYTHSGSKYNLKKVNKKYRKWCKQQWPDRQWNPKKPIRTIG